MHNMVMFMCAHFKHTVVQVSTLWQAAVAVVHSFPDSTDLIATVDALAEEEGEPPAEAFRAATNAYGAIDAQGRVQMLSLLLVTGLHGQCRDASYLLHVKHLASVQVKMSLLYRMSCAVLVT